MKPFNQNLDNSIAVIGIACQFPGAENIDEFWQNIISKKECIHFFTSEELTQAGIPIALRADPYYVPARGTIANIDKFDAPFFGFSPYEAQLTDPQHRIFLEKSWAALESAGYTPSQFSGLIGIFAGMADSTYLRDIRSQKQCSLLESDQQQIMLGTSGHFLTTKVAYALGLTGPSLNISTACSTALVAVATACQSLIDYDCDMALAGGITVITPQQSGYLYQESGILSSDGHCRPFDKAANGTVISNGCGIVVLRRLSEAIAANDNILAVIKGWAINNDGTNKAGFTAPSVNGQAACISQAIALADIDPTHIDYVEAHGTGTLLGDPIEIAALTKGYQYPNHQQAQYCAIGSVKANIGHTDVAAGAAGLIKTILALKEKTLPPLLYCDQLNENIHFAQSPFYINQTSKPWQPRSAIRTAAVNSLGFGGTNAHLILQEAPEIESGPSKSANILVISAKTETALAANTTQLADYLRNMGKSSSVTQALADASYTLQLGRKHFYWRRALTYTHLDELLQKLDQPETLAQWTHQIKSLESSRRIIFGFSGQGTQYVDMAHDIYVQQPAFKKIVDEGCEIVKRLMEIDLRRWLFPIESDQESAQEMLRDTRYSQPIIFIIEYALAKWLIELGIKPQALIGHSLGEYVAAAIAESFSFSDALWLVTARAALMAQTQPGAMLAVPLSKEELLPLLTGSLALAAHNSPQLCIVSGSKDQMKDFETQINYLLQDRDLICRYLDIDYGFHSPLMDEVLNNFSHQVKKVVWRLPKIPYLSNLTGHWVSQMDIHNPDYWPKHLRKTVLFSESIEQLKLTDQDIFIEIGPGQTLANLVRQHENKPALTLSTLPNAKENYTQNTNSYSYCLNTIARLWLSGQVLEWKSLYADENRKRVALPTYAFDDHRYWINSAETFPAAQLYSVNWQRDQSIESISSLESQCPLDSCWLIFAEKNQYCEQLVKKFTAENKTVYLVYPGENFEFLDQHTLTLRPQEKNHYFNLFERLKISFEGLQVVHCWAFANQLMDNMASILENGTYSLLYLSQAFSEVYPSKNLKVLVIVDQLHSVLGSETIIPAKSTLMGPCRVIPQEQETVLFKCIDLDQACTPLDFTHLVDWEMSTLSFSDCRADIAYRGKYRWLKRYAPCGESIQMQHQQRLKPRGVYLITGGLGGIGLTLALFLAKNYQAHLILTTRTEKLLQHEKKMVLLDNIRTFAASLTIRSVKVEDEKAMSELMGWIHNQFERIDGVIHSAAVSGQGIAQLKTIEQYQQVLLPKLQGTYNLVKLLKNEPLDFMVLFSSIHSITGYPGQIDYCSANLALDAFVNDVHFSHPVFCTVINWPSWREIGMAADSSSLLEELNESNSISAEEGIALFEKVLGSRLNQVAISHRSLDFNEPQQIISAGRIQLKKPSLQPVSKNKETLETKLTVLWQETLGVKDIGLDDDFYSLGGNSLMAISLLTKIHKKLGVQLSPTVLFKAKTIRTLSDLIEKPAEKSFISPLVLLQNGTNDHPPIFMFHPIGGTVFCYLPLVQHLSKDQTVYGLQDPSIEQSQQVFTSLEDMATTYRRALQSVQPHGPYYLCGSSFGSTLCVEIASQLLESKESVAFIGLIDGWPIFSAIQRQPNYSQMIINEHQQDPNSRILPHELSNRSLWENLLKDRISFMLNYHPKVIKAKLTLFRAVELLPEYQEIQADDNHWSAYSSFPVEIYNIPGNHNTILQEPHVQFLARHIKEIMLSHKNYFSVQIMTK